MKAFKNNLRYLFFDFIEWMMAFSILLKSSANADVATTIISVITRMRMELAKLSSAAMRDITHTITNM